MIYRVDLELNEPVLSFSPGSPEKVSLKQKLNEMLNEQVEVPLIIGGKEVRTGKTKKMVCPHDHNHVLGEYHLAGREHVEMAVEAALSARKDWAELPWESRVSVFQKMADLLAGPYRDTVNAATMLNQSKNVFQAEIDAACELIDFWRFNSYYYFLLMNEQPDSAPGMWNRIEHRGLEGFVLAVTPFNFTSIAGNLPASPALCGCVALWKPASSAVLSAYYLMRLFKDAGLPDGVINFIPGPGSAVGPVVMDNPNLAGIHFTGSTAVFQDMWKTIGNNISQYKTYPRIVGETGGKDFIFAHSTADVQGLSTALIRAAFEYQGQKCSACSRAYIPKSVWDEMKDGFLQEIGSIKVGDVTDFTNFMNAVIDKAAFDSIVEYIEYARKASDAEIIAGGVYDDSKGYFIQPTVILTDNPRFRTMEEEIFGPVLTVYIYGDNKFEETLKLCDTTSPYALTGSIFANDRFAIEVAKRELRHAAGNFYINDKCTAAVVGQQPFGGSRASGTNDKAGSILNLVRWISPRTIKETWLPPHDYRYPFMYEK
ncbi:L-glutamate gamma-semialdehyde dehydrogenase [candidate division KSB1 bacterium]